MQDRKNKCAICRAEVSEEAAVLAMGPYGTPRYLCEECASDFDEITMGDTAVVIAEAMDRVGKKMQSLTPDSFTLDTVNAIISEATERARKIESGEYDFSLDENESESFELPEELRESEEDRLLDEAEAKKAAAFDKYFNWVALGGFIAVVGFAIYMVIKNLFS